MSIRSWLRELVHGFARDTPAFDPKLPPANRNAVQISVQVLPCNFGKDYTAFCVVHGEQIFAQRAVAFDVNRAGTPDDWERAAARCRRAVLIDLRTKVARYLDVERDDVERVLAHEQGA